MKGYNKLPMAHAAAERLRRMGYSVLIVARNGWWWLDIASNDNTPPTQRSA